MRLGHRDAPGSPDRGRSPGDRESGPGRDRVVPRGIGVLLQAQNLRSGYGEMEILHGVSMTLEEREMVVLIGPNGAGKSTLIKTIFGLLRPTEGRILFRNTDITGFHPRDLVILGLGYVPQTNNTFPTLSVLENVEMGAITRRISPLPHPWNRGPDRTQSRMMNDAEIRERATETIEMFPNLQPKLREPAGSLSGGEQQKGALAETMMREPEGLLIDAPSGGLAAKLGGTGLSNIGQSNRGGQGIVMVEQNAKKALAIADRGYVLETGRNRFAGTGEWLLHNADVGKLYLGGQA